MTGSFFIRFFRMASVVMLLVAVALLAAVTTMHFAEILASTLENPAAVSGDVRLTTGRTAR